MPEHFPFARRTGWAFNSNKLIARLDEFKKAGVPFLDLTESNPCRCGFRYPAEDILSALKDTENLSYNPSAQGLPEARRAVCGYYREKGIDVRPEQVFLTASTSESYSLLFRLFLNTGERVLIPSPSYPLFDLLAQINDVVIDQYPLRYDHRWSVDTNVLARSIQKTTRAIILVHPNNPTGSFIDRQELGDIIQIARKNKLVIICDEVFSDYVRDKGDVLPSVLGNKEVPVFVLSGISKILGLPQMKLGWIIVDGPPEMVADALPRLEIISDTYLSVNTPAQNALPAWLKLRKDIQAEITGRLSRNLECLKGCIRGVPGLKSLDSQGGWYSVLRLPDGINEEEWIFGLLDEEHVFVHPGYLFDFPEEPYIVLSLLTPPEALAEGAEKIVRRLIRTKAS